MDKQPHDPNAHDELCRKRNADHLEPFETLGTFDGDEDISRSAFEPYQMLEINMSKTLDAGLERF